MTREEVKQFIANIEIYYVTNCYSLYLIHDPTIDNYVRTSFGHQMKMDIGGKQCEVHFENAFDIVNQFKAIPMNNIDHMIYPIMSSVAMIHDVLKENGLADPNNPEHEFLRHIRNAFSHGNRFHLLNGEPRRRAAFDIFEIAAGLHGTKNVVPNFVKAGDVLNLINKIKVDM